MGAVESSLPATPSWRARITGRWALSWQTYALGVLVNLPLLVVTGGRIGTRIVPVQDMGVLFLYGAGAALVAGAWALVMNATVFRHRRERPVALWQFAMLHGVSGAIFGTAIVLADTRLGIDVDVPALLTVTATVGIALWWGVTTAMLLEAHERFVRDRARLLDEAVLNQLAALQDSRAALTLADDAEVTRLLAQARERIDARRADVSLTTWLDAAQALRTAADDTIRPLSHALWEEAARRYPEPRIAGVASMLLRRPTFLPLPAASVVTIGYLAATTQAYGPLLGPALAVLLGVVSFAILSVGNTLMRRDLPLRHVIYLVSVVLVEVVALVLAYAPARVGKDLLPPSLVAGSLLGTLIAVVLTSAVASLDASRTLVISQLQSEVNRERIAQAARTRARALQLREAAKELHGTVQTRLIASASAIELAAATGDVAAYEQAMSEALSILDVEQSTGGATVAARVAVLAASWGSLCTIIVDLDPAVGSRVHDDVVRVVEEGMANAYRHGGASQIEVVIGREGDEVSVRISDDGCGPRHGAPGLGSDLLARATGGRYGLTAGSSGGAVLTAVLPAEA